MTTPSVSVIIPTYNRAEMVCGCVRSVLATGYPALEVIVVDDCSPDDTGARIARLAECAHAAVVYLRNDRNSFQAVSRNRGAAVAKGEYLFFLDDDNLVHADILTELLKVYDGHPDAALVAPLAIHRRPGKENAVWSLGSDFSRWTSQPRDLHPNLPVDNLPGVLAQLGDPAVLPTTYYPNGFMVPRRVFDEVGGFEEQYVLFFEESDFGWKVAESGYRNLIAVKAVTDHHGFLEPGCVPELRQLGIERPFRTYCLARNRVRFARRHFSFLQALSVALVFAPLSACYYCQKALCHRRLDIAWAYLRGTVAGIVGL